LDALHKITNDTIIAPILTTLPVPSSQLISLKSLARAYARVYIMVCASALTHYAIPQHANDKICRRTISRSSCNANMALLQLGRLA